MCREINHGAPAPPGPELLYLAGVGAGEDEGEQKKR